MSVEQIVMVALIGLMAGVLSGAVGVGGGIVLVPALVMGLQYSQKEAQGTTLAMLMIPVVALSVYNYYRSGVIELKNFQTALLLGSGFIFGGWLGSRFAIWIPKEVHLFGQLVHDPLQKLFALFMIVVAVRLLLK